MNHRHWEKKSTNWDSKLKKLISITTDKWNVMSWMTCDYEVEIGAQNMEDQVEHGLFSCNFGGHWSIKNKNFFCILEEL
jgi:hypothetical protein